MTENRKNFLTGRILKFKRINTIETKKERKKYDE